MASYKDEKKRTWNVNVRHGNAKRVRDLFGVNLLALYGDEGAKVLGDPSLMIDVLYVLCEEQCEHHGISDVDFGEAHYGDALEHASNALLDAVAEFYPAKKRPCC